MSVSLRRRAIAGGFVWAAIAMAVGGVILFRFIDTFTVRHFDDALNARLLQLAAAFERTSDDPSRIGAFVTDPDYSRPYSGHYWQVTDAEGEVVTSRSLFDATLAPPRIEGTQPVAWNGPGPAESLRGLSRPIVMEDGARWLLTVAETRASLEADRRLIRERLILAFAAIGLFAVGAAGVQMTLLLRPLARLRHEIAARWDLGERLTESHYPVEVVPLVRDLNAALDRNSAVIDRARRQAADLAHVLNTPSAILRNELGSYREAGIDTHRSQDALARIDAQITRSLARIRSAAFAGETNARTRVADTVGRILRVIGHAYDPPPALSARVDPEFHVAMDRQDLEEAIGNVLDNAAKWCTARVQVSAEYRSGTVIIAVDDDGPGIEAANRDEVLAEGRRLDMSKPGTGLGLTIVSDIMTAYGGMIALGRSETLGGLRAEIHIPGRRLPASVD